MRLPQRDLHQQLRAESIATRERLASTVRALDLAKLNEHPEPDGWSVGQVLERPGPTPRNGVAETLLARELRFVKAMDDATTLDWRALRIGSPALPSWAPKLNLGDGFRIHVIHVGRHSRQIERLIARL